MNLVYKYVDFIVKILGYMWDTDWVDWYQMVIWR